MPLLQDYLTENNILLSGDIISTWFYSDNILLEKKIG